MTQRDTFERHSYAAAAAAECIKHLLRHGRTIKPRWKICRSVKCQNNYGRLSRAFSLLMFWIQVHPYMYVCIYTYFIVYIQCNGTHREEIVLFVAWLNKIANSFSSDNFPCIRDLFDSHGANSSFTKNELYGNLTTVLCFNTYISWSLGSRNNWWINSEDSFAATTYVRYTMYDHLSKRLTGTIIVIVSSKSDRKLVSVDRYCSTPTRVSKTFGFYLTRRKRNDRTSNNGLCSVDVLNRSICSCHLEATSTGSKRREKKRASEKEWVHARCNTVGANGPVSRFLLRESDPIL